MKEWFKEHTEGVIMVALVLLTFAAIGVYELTQPESVQAAAQNGCVVIGTVGNVIVARCEDEDTGTVLYANSAGFMEFEP